jgi:hypothetical protein
MNLNDRRGRSQLTTGEESTDAPTFSRSRAYQPCILSEERSSKLITMKNDQDLCFAGRVQASPPTEESQITEHFYKCAPALAIAAEDEICRVRSRKQPRAVQSEDDIPENGTELNLLRGRRTVLTALFHTPLQQVRIIAKAADRAQRAYYKVGEGATRMKQLDAVLRDHASLTRAQDIVADRVWQDVLKGAHRLKEEYPYPRAYPGGRRHCQKIRKLHEQEVVGPVRGRCPENPLQWLHQHASVITRPCKDPSDTFTPPAQRYYDLLGDRISTIALWRPGVDTQIERLLQEAVTVPKTSLHRPWL